MKKLGFMVDEELWERLTILAAKMRKTKQDLIIEAIKEYLEKYGSKL
ncbi:MAG: ribbon-helix-helix domain-containing protein [Candidatus Bathyarchaeia archaeon]